VSPEMIYFILHVTVTIRFTQIYSMTHISKIM